MTEKEIQVQTADEHMTAVVVHPGEEGPFPIAVLYIDGVGYREQLKENARRFAAGGYYCVAPDLFYRSGKGLTFDVAKLAADGLKGPEAERLRKGPICGTFLDTGGGSRTRDLRVMSSWTPLPGNFTSHGALDQEAERFGPAVTIEPPEGVG